jgi:hypothetical protein
VLNQYTHFTIFEWKKVLNCLMVFFLKRILAPGLGVAAVDGLEICNAEVGKLVTRPGKSLVTTNTVDKDQKCWFPFSTGLPFTATLRMGMEGFHMTVNGKHISSFAYRQVRVCATPIIHHPSFFKA